MLVIEQDVALRESLAQKLRAEGYFMSPTQEFMALILQFILWDSLTFF
jgi:hypothetical protein